MKKRFLALVLALIMCLSLLPGTAVLADSTPASGESVVTESQAYQAMIALKGSYPEGMSWTNANYYGWKGGIYSGGYGCMGFAFILSDAAFGDLPARKVTNVKLSDVRAGDILRVDHDVHSVIVLEVNDSSVTIAEGNYNFSIHWGRTLTKQEVESADYLLTRYPDGSTQESTPETKPEPEVKPEPDPEPEVEPEPEPEPEEEPAVTEDTAQQQAAAASTWAQAEVAEAIRSALVPSDLRSSYTSAITRNDFCRLMVALVEAESGKDIASYVSSQGKTLSAPFTDTSAQEIKAAYALGIVNGVSATRFNPSGSITRQEAAAMLERTAKVLGLSSGSGASFTDSTSIASWATGSVAFVSGLTDPATGGKVMGGVSGGRFDPAGTYTREQAIATALRLFHCAA